MSMIRIQGQIMLHSTFPSIVDFHLPRWGEAGGPADFMLHPNPYTQDLSHSSRSVRMRSKVSRTDAHSVPYDILASLTESAEPVCLPTRFG